MLLPPPHEHFPVKFYLPTNIFFRKNATFHSFDSPSHICYKESIVFLFALKNKNSSAQTSFWLNIVLEKSYFPQSMWVEQKLLVQESKQIIFIRSKRPHGFGCNKSCARAQLPCAKLPPRMAPVGHVPVLVPGTCACQGGSIAHSN